VSLDGEPVPHTNDYSSRHPEHKNEVILDFDINRLAADGQFGNFTLEELRLHCQEDEQLLKLKKYIKQGFINEDDQACMRQLKNLFQELSTLDDLVFRGERLVLPRALEQRAIQVAHDGHPGVKRTKTLLRQIYWFPSLDKKVETFL